MTKNKEFYLEIYNFHKVMNEVLMAEHNGDNLSLLCNDEDISRFERNEDSMKHAKNILARFFKTFL